MLLVGLSLSLSLISTKLNFMMIMNSQAFRQVHVVVSTCRPFRVSSAQFNDVYQLNLQGISKRYERFCYDERRSIKLSVVTFARRE